MDRIEAAAAIHRGSLRMLRKLRVEDVALGLGTARASALSVVAFGGPTTITRLAELEQVRAPTMTRIVDRLQRDGLVTRERDPEDGRRVLVTATAKGLRVMEAG